MAKSEVPGWLESAIAACIAAIDRGNLKEPEVIRSLRATVKQHQEYVDALIDRHVSALLYQALRTKPEPSAEPEPQPDPKPATLATAAVPRQPAVPPRTAEQIQSMLFPDYGYRVKVTVSNYRATLRLDAHGLDVSHNLLIAQLENARTDGMKKAAERAADKYARKIEDAEVFYRLFRRQIRPDEVVEDVIMRLGETKLTELAEKIREEVRV